MPTDVDRPEPTEIMRAAIVAAMPVILALGATLILGSEVWAKDDRAAASATAAPNSVSDGGTTLRSVSVELPDPGRLFPGGDKAEAINNNCLACHSAGMVLTQPHLSRAEWQSEVDKMRNIYKAPIAAEDVVEIVDYLAGLRHK
jgi:cytochrome c5